MYLRLDNIVFTVENLNFHYGTNSGDISCFMSSCLLLLWKVWFFFLPYPGDVDTNNAEGALHWEGPLYVFLAAFNIPLLTKRIGNQWGIQTFS